MRTDERRIEKLEKHFVTMEGCLGLTGAVYLVTLNVKQKLGKDLTDLEKTNAERLSKLPPSPELVEFCETFRAEEMQINRIGTTVDGRPMIIKVVDYAQAEPRERS